MRASTTTMNQNQAPTWNHDPAALNSATDWNNRDGSGDPRNILTFGNPIGVSQSDHYKERGIRRQVWDYLTGDVPMEAIDS